MILYTRLRRLWLNFFGDFGHYKERLDMSDQTVMVLGAAHGVGRQMVFDLLALPREHRPKLLILVDDIGLDEFEKNQKFLTVQVECYHIDLGSYDECRNVIRNCTNINIVIFNSGVARQKIFDEMSLDQYMLTMEINFNSNVCMSGCLQKYS